MSKMNIKNTLLYAAFCAPLLLTSGDSLAMTGKHLTQSAPSANIAFISVDQKSLNNAEKFVTKVADQGIAFLSDETLSKNQRKTAFKKLLRNNFDMRTIARFALGRYWREANKKQQAEYMKLFEKMVLNIYAERFSEYSGQTLTVNGARAEGKKDILVHSNIADGNSGQAIKVDWRIRTKSGRSKVIDIIVEGVSMSLTQRSDFASVIQRGGGDVEVLLAHLREQ